MIAIAMIIGGFMAVWIGRSLPKEMIVSPILFMIVWDIISVSILKDYSSNVALQILVATIFKAIYFVVTREST